MALQWPSIPNTFTANSPARSAEVNANFTAMRNASAAFHSVASADYTVTDSDGYRVIYVTTGNTSRTVTLPTASDNEGRILTIKKIDSGTGQVAVSREAPATIDGATSVTLYSQNEYVTLQSNGTNWFIIGGNGTFIGPNGTASYNARVVSLGVNFSNTTTADVTVGACGLDAYLCGVLGTYDFLSSPYADQDFSLERPDNDTLRFRAGQTLSTSFIALIVGAPQI